MNGYEPSGQPSAGIGVRSADQLGQVDITREFGSHLHNEDGTKRSQLNISCGTVMMEMLLVLPLLLLILGLMFYVGRGMMRLQHTQELSRYESWRAAAHVPHDLGPHADHGTENTLLNQTFYSGAAESISFNDMDTFPTDAQMALIKVAENISIDTGNLTRGLFAALPNGYTALFATRHHTRSKLGLVFDGPIQQQHIRLDHDWRFVNGWQMGKGFLKPAPPHASNQETVRNVLFSSLDSKLDNLAQQGNELAVIIRALYSDTAAYVGPDIETD